MVELLTIIGVLAGVAGTTIAFLQWRDSRRRRRERGSSRIAAGAVLPPPLGRLPERVLGRDELIAELAAAAKSPDGRVHVLTGLGGCGKSTVALAVARLVGEERHQRLWRVRTARRRVWWVSTVDAGAVTADLLGLARRLDAPAGEVQEALAGRFNPSDVLWPRLEGTHGWVLVLDNADDLAALTAGGREPGEGAGWLRPTRAGMVLVTSRINGAAWGPLVAVHRITSLDGHDGSVALMDLAPAAGEAYEARLLAERLGGLPLALHNAGTYLRWDFSIERSFSEYRQALEKRFGYLMSRGDNDRERVTATWQISLDALAGRGCSQAGLLLRVLSCFAASMPVPPSLQDAAVLGSLCGGPDGVADGFAGLQAVGLVEVREPEHGGDRPPVVVHQLVAETIRYQAGDALSEDFAVAVGLLGRAANRLGSENRDDQPGWLGLLPHVQALLSREVNVPESVLAELASTAAAVSAALLWGGADPPALLLAESALDRVAGLGEDHEQTLALRFARAYARRYLGRVTDAELEFREILDARTRVLGSDHPDSLAARHELASVLAEEGKLAEAEYEFREVLRARTEILGLEHPATLATRHELASTLGDDGHPAEAEAELRAVLEARQRVLGPGRLTLTR